ncbi:hypothetical protein N0V83_002158 [Neocucurbitaria cava]|uniref:Myb-like domain-containing protein n=1 Tax=Neocucurbitaria cava TaxID=798079 RepID=A0A9W8YER7_9PLEO|nr:hypothetical protein N0V83_002158 [Neocucurbitaria cava]
MSDNDNGKAKPVVNPTWTEHEMLVYIFSAMEHGNLKIDFNKAPVPAGRNASGCSQKFGRMVRGLRAEIDALQAGLPLPSTTAAAAADGGSGQATPKKVGANAGGRKRKAKGEEDGSPKKQRGRSKKNAVQVEENEEEHLVKREVQDDDLEAELEI